MDLSASGDLSSGFTDESQTSLGPALALSGHNEAKPPDFPVFWDRRLVRRKGGE